MLIGVALVPDNFTINNIVSRQNALMDEMNFSDRLGYDKNMPHISLFQGNILDSVNLDFLIAQISRMYREFFYTNILEFDNLAYIGGGWYFYNCKNESKILKLHTSILGILSNSIKIDEEKAEMLKSRLSAEQYDIYLKFGYAYSLKYFSPHITIGRTKLGFEKKPLRIVEKEFNDMKPTFTVGRITLYKIGKNGVHESTIREIYV